MPKQPPIKTETLTSNPYIKRGIDKKFLTPCRQPGLSRKRKTPNSQNSSPLVTQPLVLSTSESSQKESKILEQNKEDKQHNIKKRLILNEDEPKENAKEILSDTPTTKLEPHIKDEKQDQKTQHKKHNSAKRLILDEVNSKEIANKNNSEVDSDFQLLNSERKSDSKIQSIKKKDKKTKTALKSKTENDIKPIMEKTKDLEERQSDKTEKDSNHGIVKNHEIFLKKCIVKLEKNPISKERENSHTLNKILDFKGFADELNSCISCEFLLNKKKYPLEPPKKETPNIEPIKNQKLKLKHSLSLKRENSNSEESKSDKTFFKECEEDSKNYLEEIKTLKLQIKEKQKLLTNLKQAEIYKKKHDLTELQELTNLWKQGCKAALIDLLPQMKKYDMEITMETLLKNLGVSPEVIN